MPRFTLPDRTITTVPFRVLGLPMVKETHAPIAPRAKHMRRTVYYVDWPAAKDWTAWKVRIRGARSECRDLGTLLQRIESL